MGVFRRIGQTTKSFFNVSAWMDAKRLKTGANYISSTVSSLFKVQKRGQEETFDEAMQRLELTENDIVKMRRDYLIFFFIFFIATILLLVYCLYLFSLGLMRSGFITLMLAVLAGVYAFRYHFWLYQLKNRKLGCSVREWFLNGVLKIGRRS